jgi:hypothetical protein
MDPVRDAIVRAIQQTFAEMEDFARLHGVEVHQVVTTPENPDTIRLTLGDDRVIDVVVQAIR